MSVYLPYKVTLRDSQKQDLIRAIKTKGPIKLRLHYPQLQSGNDTLGLTKTQINKIEKHRAENKGVDITLSGKQIGKQGGFIGPFLLNAAKAILPMVGVPALEGLVSGLVNKIISGSGCDYNEFAVQALPHLLEHLPSEHRVAIKKGGFVVPLLTLLASTLAPALVNLLMGKGYQVRPFVGERYQVRPPVGEGYRVRFAKNCSITP